MICLHKHKNRIKIINQARNNIHNQLSLHNQNNLKYLLLMQLQAILYLARTFVLKNNLIIIE